MAVGAAVPVVAIVLVVAASGSANAFTWPWQHPDRPQVQVLVQGDVACDGVEGGVSASPAALTLDDGTSRHTLRYPETGPVLRGQVFGKPTDQRYWFNATVPKDKDKVTVNWSMTCYTVLGVEDVAGKSFTVSRSPLTRHICSAGGLSPCVGTSGPSDGCRFAVFTAVTKLDALTWAVETTQADPSTTELVKEALAHTNPLVGLAVSCLLPTKHREEPAPSVPAAVPTVPVPARSPVTTLQPLPVPSSAAPPAPSLPGPSSRVPVVPSPPPAPPPASTEPPSSAPPAPPPPPPPVPPVTQPEVTGGVVHTWTNYTNAGGYEGPQVPPGTTVQIACKLRGFAVANGNTWWYRIASGPWDSQYYASADAFYNNGQTTGSLLGTPYVDPAVNDC